MYFEAETNVTDQLFGATMKGNAEVCKLLIEKGADVHVCDEILLRFAVDRGYVGVCRVLLAHGANVHVHSGSQVARTDAWGCQECVLTLKMVVFNKITRCYGRSVDRSGIGRTR